MAGWRRVGGMLTGAGFSGVVGVLCGNLAFGYQDTGIEKRTEKSRPIFDYTWNKPDLVSFDPDEYREFPLKWSKDVTHDTKLCRFLLPSENHRMGMDVASYILARFRGEDGKDVIRPYTPVSSDWNFGYFDLLIKKYPNSKMGTHIHNFKPGDLLQVQGPFKKIDIKENQYGHVGLIAGGTGITPMFQILRYLSSMPKDSTHVTLIYANRSPDDILLQKELRYLELRHDRLNIYYTVNEANREWKGGIGNISKEVLEAYLPKPGEGKVFVCGPPGMMKHLSGELDWSKGKPEQGPLTGLLKQMGYTEADVFKF